MTDELYMRRALQLARCGDGFVSPNPMVGAVIVCDGSIIGEGYHRRYGEGHAEGNAVASVADKSLLKRSTIYVTLEPCSHYGKTPPCAKLLIDCGIPRVVIGCMDPFSKVNGRGVAMLRDAGADVTTGVLRQECMTLNKVFMVSHKLRRPYVILKWAQSADGYIDSDRQATDGKAERFSSAATSRLVHLLRSRCDAIMVGSGTALADNPQLNVRGISGRQPVKVLVDSKGEVAGNARIFNGKVLCFGPQRDVAAGSEVEFIADVDTHDIEAMLHALYERGVTSLLVEGGCRLLNCFIDSCMWDECRIEKTSRRLGESGRHPMHIPAGILDEVKRLGDSEIITVQNPTVTDLLA